MSITSSGQPNSHADREKRMAALSSVVAAIFLTGMKIVVGLLTGSLGILSEAAHSALDLVAAAVTFFAVRLSSRAPDRRHTYGYGKVEIFPPCSKHCCYYSPACGSSTRPSNACSSRM